MDDNTTRSQLAELHPAGYGWALACCGRDPAAAEDVLQTACLKVLQGRARFDGRSSFKTWWFAVIRHTAADERRRHWLRRLRLAAFGALQSDRVHEEAFGDALDCEQRQAAFAKALAVLPERQREVLHLVFYQELSIEAAAEVLGVSAGTARTHYTRGKQRLRAWLQQAEVSHEPARSRQSDPALVL
ncbi:MAG: RNA polymerase sigma factor [Verrucomicrobia bacterium]|nr:RNA polymerase sigma factor [Verrucomicrobiota bacterium]